MCSIQSAYRRFKSKKLIYEKATLITEKINYLLTTQYNNNITADHL